MLSVHVCGCVLEVCDPVGHLFATPGRPWPEHRTVANQQPALGCELRVKERLQRAQNEQFLEKPSPSKQPSCITGALEPEEGALSWRAEPEDV